jgi:hypothetical protein
MATETVKFHDQCQVKGQSPHLPPALQAQYSRSLQMENRKRKPSKEEEKDTEREGERNGKQPKPHLFRHFPPFHRGLTRSSIPRPVSSSPRLPPIQLSSVVFARPQSSNLSLVFTRRLRPGPSRKTTDFVFVALFAAVLLPRFLSAPRS